LLGRAADGHSPRRHRHREQQLQPLGRQEHFHYGPGGRNLKATQIGNTTLAKGSGSNNVYAGRDGQVYRRNESGDWQKYEGKGEGWSDVRDRPDRPNQDLPGDRGNRDLGNRAETRQSLDRNYQSRQSGEMRSQQFRSGGGFQGGGGRMGGGGRGGRR